MHAPHLKPALPVKCAACNRPMDSPLFCGGCHSLYPADETNYFELLGLETGYDLDVAALRGKYLGLARTLHPDRFAGADAEAARLSLQTSARLNRAFEVLSDPILRAEYLLELAGGPSAAEDKTVPQEVLTHALLLQEEIQDAKAAGDQNTLTACKAQARTKYDELLNEVTKLARPIADGGAETQKTLRNKLNAIKYYQRMLEQL